MTYCTPRAWDGLFLPVAQGTVTGYTAGVFLGGICVENGRLVASHCFNWYDYCNEGYEILLALHERSLTLDLSVQKGRVLAEVT